MLTGVLVAHGAAAGCTVGMRVVIRLLTMWLAVAIGLLALLYSAAIARDISFRQRLFVSLSLALTALRHAIVRLPACC